MSLDGGPLSWCRGEVIGTPDPSDAHWVRWDEPPEARVVSSYDHVSLGGRVGGPHCVIRVGWRGVLIGTPDPSDAHWVRWDEPPEALPRG